MGFLLFIAFGFVIGLVARALMPGDQQMGIIMTTGLGMAGSFAGGFLSSLWAGQRVTEFHTAGAIGSILGALLLLFLIGTFLRRRAHV
jgi:uncharacterized membrane protein YeaQ/YmgE (transglycosylase-associated protein family)